MTLGIIYCYTNKINGKKYIGQTIRGDNRKTAHKHMALETKSNMIFHKAIRKYGWENFDYEILIECAEEELTAAESMYITEMATLQPRGYNQLLGSNHTPETRKKSSATKKLRYSEMPLEERQARTKHLWESRIGAKQTDHQKRKATEANQKRWLITDPSGRSFEIVNLHKFCSKNNINDSNLITHGHTKGFKCQRLD